MTDVETATGAQATRACDHDLLSPVSQQRGFCEACRIDWGIPVEPYDYRRIPDPGPKLLAAMDAGDFG